MGKELHFAHTMVAFFAEKYILDNKECNKEETKSYLNKITKEDKYLLHPKMIKLSTLDDHWIY